MSTPEPPDPAALPTVAVVTLGCARNEVDSEELAGRLAAGGFRLVADPERAESVLVNTCGFVEAAKKDSVDALLAAADLKGGGVTRRVVAVGCLAERYGAELADALPEADAVLGFDDYESIAERLRGLVAGAPPPRHVPRDRRLLLPIAPVERAGTTSALPGHGALAATRRRLDSGPTAALKLASGCDRRCAFCAIPSFRGRFVSRSPGEVLAEARWLASEGVKELFLVSENTTSYGKDLGEPALLDSLLPTLAGLEGIERVRVSYLQPAELRPALVEAIAGTPGVAAYFDLSFQHASAAVLRRMRRFGDAESFLALLDRIRELVPTAGIRSNLIVGFPGETEADVEILTDFLQAAHLDVTGVFGYSDEDGTEAAAYDDKLDEDEIRSRVERVVSLVDELTAQRAEQRIGERLRLLVEARDGRLVEGRADHQGPDVDGSTTMEAGDHRIGDLVTAEVIGTDGADLVARPIGAAT